MGSHWGLEVSIEARFDFLLERGARDGVQSTTKDAKEKQQQRPFMWDEAESLTVRPDL